MEGVLILAGTVVAILCGIAILTGGIVLFAVGRGNSRMSSAGFVILGTGTIVGAVTLLALNVLEKDAFGVHRVVEMVVQLVFDAVGWTLLVLATNRLRKTEASPATGYGDQHPPAH
ncbi:hypothetical protein [Actinomadura verrucosospora]|uniref:Uncharacterized protein n=1 Tax=Actinomadura verrucosospora TaxID=46165 RepID=A0A7D3VNB5_ACTVE|nr:hypothetical protein [Actinomadura verrucosospora]QKG18598.1 hypothetical protein ACTIVE_0232 [Actinomadura verrucosospora]